MKKVLIIKTSSLGDVIHTLPAVSDAKRVLGEVQFDWVVEENFAEIPAWHPAVRKVIPVAIRRWRKHLGQIIFGGKEKREWNGFKQQLQQEQYDVVIDAQGLLKSALITRLARGETYGLDKHSAREAIASRFYQHPKTIAKQQHAVERVRELFAKCLGYQLEGLPLDYGIAKGNKSHTPSRQILFLHGTTWDTKHWPEQYWIELASQITGSGYSILIPWGNDIERQRALRIKHQCKHENQLIVLDKMGLNDLLEYIIKVDAVIAVDTGLAHLSAALDKPTVSLYGPTSPDLTGTYGANQMILQVDYECSPCFSKNCVKTKAGITPECYTSLNPQRVMNVLNELLYNKDHDRQAGKEV